LLKNNNSVCLLLLVDCSSSKYCINGGTCHENGGSYTCTCAEGYEGDNCQYI